MSSTIAESEKIDGVFASGDPVEIVGQRHTGERDVVAEIDSDDGNVRLQNLGWFEPGELKHVLDESPAALESDGQNVIETSVDGEVAKVVLDGTVPSSPSYQEPLLEVSMEALEIQLADQNDRLTAIKEYKKEVAADCKIEQDRLNAIVAEIARRTRKTQLASKQIALIETPAPADEAPASAPESSEPAISDEPAGSEELPVDEPLEDDDLEIDDDIEDDRLS